MWVRRYYGISTIDFILFNGNIYAEIKNAILYYDNFYMDAIFV